MAGGGVRCEWVWVSSMSVSVWILLEQDTAATTSRAKHRAINTHTLPHPHIIIIPARSVFSIDDDATCICNCLLILYSVFVFCLIFTKSHLRRLQALSIANWKTAFAIAKRAHTWRESHRIGADVIQPHRWSVYVYACVYADTRGSCVFDVSVCRVCLIFAGDLLRKGWGPGAHISSASLKPYNKQQVTNIFYRRIVY